jgi:2-polyprenyl-3-methyl-5-hydroxy-6-metoxy-1,4-benzoquinol methylase
VPEFSPDEAKSGGYYANARPDITEALPRPVGSVLDVGCGEGAVCAGLRAAGATRMIGVEMVPAAAERARSVVDEVIVGTVEEALPSLAGPFDTVLCLDVLEHLVDPAAVLRGLHAVTRPGGWLQVSVPNARHVSLLRDLVLRGTFGYTDWGHRDSTHLRWFTRADMVRLLGETGWSVERVSHPALGRSRGLDRLTGGRSTEFLVGQWYLGARRL